MKLSMRTYRDEEDYWRIREFLRAVMILNSRREFAWHVARLDYWWWFCNVDLEKIDPHESIFLWEAEDGILAAVLNPEQRGYAFLQVHPEYVSDELVEEMIAVAEQRLNTVARDGMRKVRVLSDSRDKTRQEILARRGFARVDQGEVVEFQHRRSLKNPLPEIPKVPGYTFRSLGDGLELLERCYASGLGFHDDLQTACDNRDDPTWYRHIQSAPLYRRDLDIVAVAEDGSIASFCTMWFDDVSRTAYIEPVATVPAHRKRGLGKAALLTGLQRLKHMGCEVAFVGGYSDPANALYFSVMGPDHDVSEPWEKVISSG